jgi:hypothetical protein
MGKSSHSCCIGTGLKLNFVRRKITFSFRSLYTDDNCIAVKTRKPLVSKGAGSFFNCSTGSVGNEFRNSKCNNKLKESFYEN